MNDQLAHLEVEVELSPGEKLSLPPAFVDSVGPGRWLITVEPVQSEIATIRSHDAFLAGYSASDEGLYDDAGR